MGSGLDCDWGAIGWTRMMRDQPGHEIAVEGSVEEKRFDFPRSSLMCPLLTLPPELFYQIALHLPLTSDVLALGLTSSRVHNALSTPALFKARLALQGWDASAWQNKNDDGAQSLIMLKRWMRIDHIHCKTTRLFEENAQENPVLFSVEHNDDVELGQGRPTLTTLLDPRRVLDGKKTFSWLRKLSDVLPMFITHHRMFRCLLSPFSTDPETLASVPGRWRKHLADHRGKTSQRVLSIHYIRGCRLLQTHTRGRTSAGKSVRV
ncbi:hypothetical protein BC827DRAFT_824692 [Russula dissimulans]|nr:hypothetical protein BC827DRAFT_824692 [Russula dissimulans]